MNLSQSLKESPFHSRIAIMSMELDKKALEHLAKLARINLSTEEEDKLLKDLRNRSLIYESENTKAG